MKRNSLFVLLMAFLAAGFVGAVAAADGKAPVVPPLVHTVQVDPDQSFRVLCWHDIRDRLSDTLRDWPEPTAVDAAEFARQLSWLQENGYHPVSLQQIIDARAGRSRLPDKAVLLTFDDGYESVYTHVFPLLKQFGFPAVIALVGDWIQTPQGQTVAFGDAKLARSDFASWDQIREMQSSGLIEVASHTYDLHKGVVANPQGSSLPAVVSRLYRTDTRSYENERDYEARIRTDLQHNSTLIRQETGKAPRAVVWPYGAYNVEAAKWAAEAGMPVTMSLDPGVNTPQDPLSQVRRNLVNGDMELGDFISTLQSPSSYRGVENPLERVLHVDLDYVYDPDPVQQEKNLSALIDHVYRLHPTTVYLQAYSDPQGTGEASSLYFPNRHMPMRADLFSRVAWQLHTRAQVAVYAWMPVMAFHLPAGEPGAGSLVTLMPGAPAAADHDRYRRLSLFDPVVRQTITEIYEDLGRHAQFDGVLFHDDATLSDYEDASPAALAYYRDQWHLPASVDDIRSDPALLRQWTQHKTAFINDFTVSLITTLRNEHPQLLSARNLYAQPVLNPASEEWFAQTLHSALGLYDFTVIMAMPYMEGASRPDKWLSGVLARVKAEPEGLRKTVFELQSVDWKRKKPIPAVTLAHQWKILHLGGARNWGYYPDDFLRDQPQEKGIRPAISVETALRRP